MLIRDQFLASGKYNETPFFNKFTSTSSPNAFQVNFTRTFDILPYQLQRFPQKHAAAGRMGSDWDVWPAEKLIEASDQLSAGLLEKPYKKGDRVGIWVHAGSPEWVVFDRALQQIGLIPVPLHVTSRKDELQFIAQHADLKACVISNQELLDRWTDINPQVDDIITLRPLSSGTFWKGICSPDLKALNARRDQIKEEDPAVLLYTSGTSGMPKGVLLSHRNVVSNVKSVLAFTPVEPDETVVSFLPLSHVMERCALYTYLAAGAQIWFLGEPSTIESDIREIRPHFFTAVPRILERMYERAREIGEKGSPWKRRFMSWAMQLSMQYPFYVGEKRFRPWYRFQLQLARIVVFNRLKRMLGGRVHGIVVGAAALAPRIARFFAAAGVPVREGYGLTETSPVVAFNRFEPGGTILGTVGLPAPGVEVRISEQDEDGNGEIQVKGPNVMHGYWNAPEENAAVFTDDGWLRTGDLGAWKYGRFLKVTGRRSELFKTSSGKFVAPAFVEEQLRKSIFIDQALVVGLNKPHVAALIVPDFVQLERWCVRNGVHWTAPQYMVHNLRVQQFLQAELDRINGEELSKHERVLAHHLVHEPWTAENGMLTPTLKLRRAEISKAFEKEIEGMFEE